MTNTEQMTEKQKFDKVINEMETVIDVGLKIPPFGTVVSTKELRNQLSFLKKAVNDAVEEAEHIVSIKEKLLNEARQEADEIVRRRQMEVSKQPVIKEAELYAKKILIQAKEEAERMRKEAVEFQKDIKVKTYEYADMIFDELEKNLNDKRKTVNRNRQDFRMMFSDSEVEKAQTYQQNLEEKRAISQ